VGQNTRIKISSPCVWIFSWKSEKGQEDSSLRAGFKYTSVNIDVSYLFSASKVPNPLEKHTAFSLTFNFGDKYEKPINSNCIHKLSSKFQIENLDFFSLTYYENITTILNYQFIIDWTTSYNTKLMEQAVGSRKKAYAPYSKFKVEQHFIR
jgi:hypothetical protein